MAELLNNPDYLYSLVKKIEDQFPVEKLTFCGEMVWNAIRPLLCGAHMWSYNELGGIEGQMTRKCLPIYESLKGDGRRNRSKFFIKEMEHSFLLSEFRTLDNIDVIFFDAIDCYAKNDDGEFISSVLDPFWEYFKEHKCLSMLPFDNRNKKLNFKRDTVFYRNLSDRFVDHVNYSSRVKNLKELMLFIKENNIPIPFTSNKIESWVRSIYIRGDIFANIFNKIKPKVVFITSFRSSERMAVVRACKLLNIPVIEIQHGILGPEYYNLNVKSKHEWVPDAFWLWGDASLAKMVSNNTRTCINHLVGGKPNIINHIPNSLSPGIPKRSDKTVLFIEQYTHANFSKLIKDCVVKLMASGGEWRFLLRLHPKSIHLINKYKNELLGLNVSIDIPTYGKLYDVLLSSDVVVAESSTVAYEANALGKKVIVYGSNAKSFFREEIKFGVFLYAKTESEISTKILFSRNIDFVKADFFNCDIDRFNYSLDFCRRIISA
ncbi:hypothetical protein ELS78_02340 [Aeromonas veronii]|uniref:glycosyltransferase n=1 Tax=Aeromonas veronii TaxID=654 RepID=UPI000F8E6156|nr:glycosyltransferase [Aeromonas veronii]RUR59215.1 hypothetical protein ELS78_02340 [Aeromonas veronii]